MTIEEIEARMLVLEGRFGKIGRPDLSDAVALQAWIAHVRTLAFGAGARHEEIDLCEARRFAATASAGGEPIAWVSPGQLRGHPDRPPGDGGAYLPVRRSRDGNFTMPLFSAPTPELIQDVADILAGNEADMRAEDDLAAMVRNALALEAHPAADEEARARVERMADECRQRAVDIVNAQKRGWWCAGDDCTDYDHGRDEGLRLAAVALGLLAPFTDEVAAALRHRPVDAVQAAAPRLPDDALNEHLPDRIRAKKRCGIQKSVWLDGWFVPWSPRNGNESAEGPWSHWVALANAILKEDQAATTAALARENRP